MADVRTLLKNERNSRRIQHPHATYSTTDVLICLICNIQLKSDFLWTPHQRSPNHVKKLQGSQNPASTSTAAPAPTPPLSTIARGETLLSPSKKRKASRDNDGDNAEPRRKRTQSHAQPLSGFLPAGFFDNGTAPSQSEESYMSAQKSPKKTTPPMPQGEFTLASRPLTPLTSMDTSTSNSAASGSEAPTPTKSASAQTAMAAPAPRPGRKGDPRMTTVDEDEWAAFESDIAGVEAVQEVPYEAIIVAPPMTPQELAAKSREEEILTKRQKEEASREFDQEMLISRIEDEKAQMEELEERFRRLEDRRKAARKAKETIVAATMDATSKKFPTEKSEAEEQEDDGDGDLDDEDWLRG